MPKKCYYLFYLSVITHWINYLTLVTHIIYRKSTGLGFSSYCSILMHTSYCTFRVKKQNNHCFQSMFKQSDKLQYFPLEKNWNLVLEHNSDSKNSLNIYLWTHYKSVFWNNFILFIWKAAWEGSEGDIRKIAIMREIVIFVSIKMVLCIPSSIWFLTLNL